MQLSKRIELALALVATAPTLAYDIETSGLEQDARVAGYAVSDGRLAVYVPVRHETGNVDDPELFERRLNLSFRDRSRRDLLTVGFNIGFDLFHSGRYGVFPGAPIEDAQINEVLIYEYHRAYDLESCLQRRGFPGKDDEGLLHELARRFGGSRTRRVQMRNFWRLSGEGRLAWDYATSDVLGTYRLWAVQQEEIARPDAQGHTLEKVHRLECDLIPHLARMRCKGIRIDKAYTEQAVATLDERIDKALQNFPQGFNPARVDELHAWMTGKGAASQYLTGTGKPSYTSKTLEGSEAGRQVTELRQLLKTRSTFLSPMLGVDRIYPELKQMSDGEYGVKFGRFSCVGPNLQAFPKRNKQLGQIVRPVIVPDHGMTLYEADYSQQEPRLYAHFARCERLLQGYNNQPVIDVHTLASQLMGIDRNHAKTLGLSIFNGMTPRTLAGRLGVDEPEAKRLYQDFFKAFPEIADFKRDAASVAAQRGYVRTILGRRQHFPPNLSTHVAVSRVIQGSAGDHMKVRLLEACQWVEACGAGQIDILMTIHDAVIWQAACGMGLGELRKILENNGAPLFLSTPMPVEVAAGRNWAEASWPELTMRAAA
jgi:DNA polymerase I-like protein with 3'-5' exonuclease and polymerase domains